MTFISDEQECAYHVHKSAKAMPFSTYIVSIAEMYYPLPKCVYIYGLVFVNALQVSINVNRCNFFTWKISASYELSYKTPFCHTAAQLLSLTR